MTGPQDPSTEPAILEVSDYKVGFKTERGLAKAVDGVSFSLRRGKALGIVGESGSGKSVLNRSLMGLVTGSRQIEEGSVIFDGQELVNTDRQRVWGKRISMIFQNPMTSLNPVMRVGKQITESLQLHLDLDKNAARGRAIELLAQVGIPEPSKRVDQYPHELSGGMRQRVMIAIALSGEPELLVADEPTTALDVTVQKYILDLLRDLQVGRNMAMILITHDLGVARGRTDSIMVLYSGRIMEVAPTETLFADMRHPYTAALLESTPRLSDPKHTRLSPIPGAPPDIINLPPGCRFAPRCKYAQPRCMEELPQLQQVGFTDHYHSCFFPIGTEAGDEALARNEAAGETAVGLAVTPTEEA